MPVLKSNIPVVSLKSGEIEIDDDLLINELNTAKYINKIIVYHGDGNVTVTVSDLALFNDGDGIEISNRSGQPQDKMFFVPLNTTIDGKASELAKTNVNKRFEIESGLWATITETGADNVILENAEFIESGFDPTTAQGHAFYFSQFFRPFFESIDFSVLDGRFYIVDTTLGSVEVDATNPDVRLFFIGDFEGTWSAMNTVTINTSSGSIVFGIMEKGGFYMLRVYDGFLRAYNMGGKYIGKAPV